MSCFCDFIFIRVVPRVFYLTTALKQLPPSTNLLDDINKYSFATFSIYLLKSK